MNEYNNKDLFLLSNQLRKEIIDISYKSKAHHIGSEFSCIDLLTSLFFNYIDLEPNNFLSNKRDWFMIGKGHASLAYYVILSKKGFFSIDDLVKNFLKDGGLLGGHPDKSVMPGIDINSGSLGHSLSIASGIALAAKKDDTKRKSFVLLGDGECNEGMIWESALFSAQHKLDNLIAIVDLNGLQGLGRTEEVISLQSLPLKFESFGWNVQEIDGHDFSEINESFKSCGMVKNKPNIIIAKTIKGKGAHSMEDTLKSHYETLTKERYEEVSNELNDYIKENMPNL
jgi:transketolase